MAHVVLIVSGGIAAYRALDVARNLRRNGHSVTPVMTASSKKFVAPLSFEVLCGAPVHDKLFSSTDESTIDHIALARSADCVVCCPATAHLIARMAHGNADDLATTLLLTTRAPILLAPAMNVRMWDHPATQENIALLKKRGVRYVGPDEGVMACGEYGVGRLSAPDEIVDAVEEIVNAAYLLKGRRVLVTAGPTVEPIDPVRFLSNHSSGLQGYAIAEAVAHLGADVMLVSGPVSLETPSSVTRINVQTAQQMKDACFNVLPVDAAVCVAAVSDWRPKYVNATKTKKKKDAPAPIELVENPDILRDLCNSQNQRPSLVVGFAAETDHMGQHAREKYRKKGCDWLLANDVSKGVFGEKTNTVHFLTSDGVEEWPTQSKKALAMMLAQRMASFLNQQTA